MPQAKGPKASHQRWTKPGPSKWLFCAAALVVGAHIGPATNSAVVSLLVLVWLLYISLLPFLLLLVSDAVGSCTARALVVFPSFGVLKTHGLRKKQPGFGGKLWASEDIRPSRNAGV